MFNINKHLYNKRWSLVQHTCKWDTLHPHNFKIVTVIVVMLYYHNGSKPRIPTRILLAYVCSNPIVSELLVEIIK